jgi:SAM-dependent methyltransferase
MAAIRAIIGHGRLQRCRRKMMPFATLRRHLQSRAEEDERTKALITRLAAVIGYDLTRITRRAYWTDCRQLIDSLQPQTMDVIEISAGETWRNLPFRSYRTLDYPEHDICAPLDPALVASCDLVIADQVFEHLLWPYRAGRNVLQMLRPGGHFLVMTPFLIRVHEVPYDCTRWTETGMRHFLAECGFEFDTVKTSSWGNMSALKACLATWGRVGWRRNFPNDPRFPLMVWALARRPA